MGAGLTQAPRRGGTAGLLEDRCIWISERAVDELDELLEPTELSYELLLEHELETTGFTVCSGLLQLARIFSI